MTNNLAWFWHRLRVMKAREIGQRFWQKALRGQQRQAWRMAGLRKSKVEENSGYPFLPDKSELAALVGEQVTAQANKISSGFFRLFGHERVEVGNPPQWNREPLAKLSHPSKGSSWKVRYKILPDGADCRVFWEINRWREILCLAEAGWLTQRFDFSATARDWLVDWQKNNPMGKGINWTSPLESAIRLLHLVWIDRFLCESLTPENWASTKARQQLIASHAWWTNRYQSFGSSANNHLLGELAALACACRRWPHLAKSAIPEEEIGQRLQTEILHQFATDGGNKEQALHYHFFAMLLGEMGCAALMQVKAETRQRLDLAAAFFAEVAVAGEAWDYGDSDDAIISPFFFTGSPVAAWLEWYHHGGEQKSELGCWLGAPKKRSASSKQMLGWNYFEQSGMATRAEGLIRFRLDASPLGFLPIAAHGHLDALHLSVWHGDKAVLIDPGTGGYYANPDWRNHLTDWAAHNGPHFQDSPFGPTRTGPFLWGQIHSSPEVRTVDGQLACVLDFNGETLERKITVFSEGWRVSDRSGGKSKAFRVHWQLAPEWQWEASDICSAVFRRDSLRLKVVWNHDSGAHLVRPGEEKNCTGLHSRNYGQISYSRILALQSGSEGTLETTFTLNNDDPAH